MIRYRNIQGPVAVLFTALAFFLTTTQPALANEIAQRFVPGEPVPLTPDDKGTFTFIWENDSFGGTDRNYTNGNRISYLSPTQNLGDTASKAAHFLLNADGTDNVRFGLAAGHSIFTPEDIDATQPLPDQHPYAGYLYGEAALQVERTNALDTLTIQLGIVGDAALGEQVQNNFHKLVGVDEAKGWDNQLANEPAFLVSYDRSLRSLYEWQGAQGARLDGYGFDVTPSLGFTLGNVLTQAQGGLTIRFGENLQNDFGPPRVRPALAGGSFFNPADDFSWYVFGGVVGRLVGYNIFLDGNLLRSGGPRVNRRPVVADFQIGVAVQWREIQLAYTYVARTEEFTTQRNRQIFGAFSLSAKF